MAEILIYTDFDGTVTGSVGAYAVNHPFYKSLFAGVGNYHETPMRAPKELQLLFEKKFGNYNLNFNWNQPDTNLLMNPEAVNFFHQTLTNPQIKIHIVTRNVSAYVTALFRYQGFSEKEIMKLNIMELADKFHAVKANLEAHQSEAQHIYVLDDSEEDYNKMLKATAYWSHYQTHHHNEKPGQFRWNNYLKEIKTLLANKTSVFLTSYTQPLPKRENFNTGIKPLQNILSTLIVNISNKKEGRETWFDTNSEGKIRKLQTILNWLNNLPELDEQSQEKTIALIKGVCAIKRNSWGIFQPHSASEFSTLLANSNLKDFNNYSYEIQSEDTEKLLLSFLNNLRPSK